ncbi:MAG: hypothetical protein L6427_07610 [Actinomycetia bacterium]|nr:hypothetical protein [Actinomycetes bacterium]
MKEGLREKIESRGYWRFLFHPVEFKEDRLTRVECYEAVERNNVTLRGWDYPHVEPQGRGDGRSLAEFIDDGSESWTDWASQMEFWRYYRSGQFIHYRALSEDWQDEHGKVLDAFTAGVAKGMGAEYKKSTPKVNQFPNNTRLEFVGVIYEIAEVFEFWRKMVSDLPEIYESGLAASVEVHNSGNRQLVTSEFQRAAIWNRRSAIQTIIVPKSMAPQDVVLDTVKQTLDVIMEIFDAFGFAPSRENILTEVERYLAGSSR